MLLLTKRILVGNTLRTKFYTASVGFLHRPGLPERTLGAEYFGLHSHTGIHKFCRYCSNTYLHGAFLSFLTTPIVFLLPMTKLY